MPSPPPRRHSPIRLFVIESAAPVDLLTGTAEAPALGAAATLIGHEVASISVRTRAEFADACRYISSIGDYGEAAGEDIALYVHIAAHGDADGIGFGHDKSTWAELVEDLEPLMMMTSYEGNVVVVLSACHAVDQRVTELISRRAKANRTLRPPSYLFATTTQAVDFRDALVSWIVFYHQISSTDLSEKRKVQRVLDRVKEAGAEKLTYFRWDGPKRSYLRYSPKPKVKPKRTKTV